MKNALQYKYPHEIHAVSCEDRLAANRPRRQSQDTETTLYYLQSRYYDPEMGRFINADDTTYLGADGTHLSNNLYAYCANNPINRTDTYGNWSGWATAGVIVGAVLVIAAITVLTCGVGTATLAGTVAVGAAKGALVGAAVGTAAGAGLGYATTGTLQGAATGAAIGFGAGAVVGAIVGGASSGLGYAKSHGLKIEKIGRIEASNHPNDAQLGVKFQINKPNGRPTTRSFEFHYNHAHKNHKPHWQLNSWNPYNNSVSSLKHWTLWGKRIS